MQANLWNIVKLTLVLMVVSASSQSLYEDSKPVCTGDRPAISTEKTVPTNEDDGNLALLSYGKDLQVFCTGSASKNLAITSVIDEDIEEYLETKVINETTVSWFVEKLPKMSVKYNCIDNEKPCTDAVGVVVDSDPELTDFQCISSNFVHLNCSWSSSSVTPTFTLFNIKEDQPTVLCKLQGRPDLAMTKTTTTENTYFCTWYLTNALPRYEPRKKTITFLMQTCNAFGCRNDTFKIDHYSILKLASPRDLAVLKRSSHSVSLSWSIPYESWRFISTTGVDHRVDFISQETQKTNHTEVNTSFLPIGHLTYEIVLNLPYPGTYEARVSIKPKTASDEFWSDYAYISFNTREERKQTAVRQ